MYSTWRLEYISLDILFLSKPESYLLRAFNSLPVLDNPSALSRKTPSFWKLPLTW